MTVRHNGVTVHDKVTLPKGTGAGGRRAEVPKGGIHLQGHGNPVRFRNIWVREFSPAKGEHERPPFIRDGDKETPIAATEN